jgi:hypothetical protein
MGVMEFMCVTDVGGPFRNHIQVQDASVHTIRYVELLKDTRLLTLRRLPSRLFLMMTMFLMKNLKPLVRILAIELCFFSPIKLRKRMDLLLWMLDFIVGSLRLLKVKLK